MSYTNKTTHYELPQYLATDKPKYLTDFNETMQAIDAQMYVNAQAAAAADSKAVGAKETADGAVSSIGALNTQINGDPSDPSNNGLAGDVSRLEGDVNTIQSLLGSGSPTTSNQTVIGAINAIEGAIAPAEDAAALGASYAAGAQFARGGVIYKALHNLTSGTAFTSLVLNTDFAVSDTIVKQIADVDTKVVASVTADGVKTRAQLFNELYTAFEPIINRTKDYVLRYHNDDDMAEYHLVQINLTSGSEVIKFTSTYTSYDIMRVISFLLIPNNSASIRCENDVTNGLVFTDTSSAVVATGRYEIVEI